MCFSATASFTVGATLTVVGVATLQRTASWREVPLAATPLIFAVQQFVEGALWLRLGSGTDDAVTVVLVHSYLFFALVMWPVLVPVTALLIEPQPHRRRVIRLFVPWGLLVGGYLLTCMILSPYEATIYNDHLFYKNEMENTVNAEYIYLIGVSTPLVLSSHRVLMLLGILNVVLLAIIKYYFAMTYVSVWCYYAAVTSIMILAHFYTSLDLRGGLMESSEREERVGLS